MDRKEKATASIIREDYDHPLLQELLAELIYETQKYNGNELKKRMDVVLYQILGDPARSLSYVGNEDDSHDLYRVAALHKRYVPSGKKQITLGMAVAFVARQKFIPGHNLYDPVPKNLSDGDQAKIAAYQKRLKAKLAKSDLDDLLRQGVHRFYEVENHVATIGGQVRSLANLAPVWVSRYLRPYLGQCTFFKKDQKK